MTELKAIYIPEGKLSRLEKIRKELGKKALKLGFNAPIIKVYPNDCRLDKHEIEFYQDGSTDYRNVIIKKIKVEYSIPEYKIPDWIILGCIDVKNNLIIDENNTIPMDHRNFDTWCDHCNTGRRRNRIIVIRHTSGDIKRVGSTCLKEFIGIDGEQMVSFLEYVKEFYNISEYEPCVSDFQPGYDFNNVLKASIISIKFYGFTSTQDPYNQSTRDHVIEILEKNKLQKLQDEKNFIIAQDLINDVKNYWINSDQSEAFNFNMKNIIESKYVNDTTIGILVYAYAGYLKALNSAVRDTLKETSKYQYSIGEKFQAEVKYNGGSSFDSMYGTIYIERFILNGNLIVWKTSKAINLKKDETYTLKGAVKAHEEYREVKQTIVTRCKIV